MEATKRHVSGAYVEGDWIDENLYAGWKLKARNLLVMACGEASEHYRTFVKLEDGTSYATNHETMLKLKAVFEAAREDYEGGYCNSVRHLVQAEVFGNELDQARELLGSGYRSAAAVIAGVVLETALRELCGARSLPVGKLDRMNAELAKAGHYSLLVQKRITALADVRNSAAHGHSDRFSDDDVRDMITYVEKFVADQI